MQSPKIDPDIRNPAKPFKSWNCSYFRTGLWQGLAINLEGIYTLTPVELLKPATDPIGGWFVNESGLGDQCKWLELLLELGNAHPQNGEKDHALQRWREGIHGAEGEKRLFIGLNIAQVLCGLRQIREVALLGIELGS